MTSVIDFIGNSVTQFHVMQFEQQASQLLHAYLPGNPIKDDYTNYLPINSLSMHYQLSNHPMFCLKSSTIIYFIKFDSI